MEKWFDVPEKEGSSVICSRVRLVRNWREYPFPGKMTKEQSVEMTGRLMNGVKESGAFPAAAAAIYIWTGSRTWSGRRF